MYCISIYKEVSKEVYYRLIEYSLSKSDAFMLVVWRYNKAEMLNEEQYITEVKKQLDDILEKDSIEYKELYTDIVNHGYEKYKQSFLKNIKIDNSLDEKFNKGTECFLKKTERYLLKSRNNPIWPSNEPKYGSNVKEININVYKVCDEVKQYLMDPQGLFNWKYPNYPDDLCFFKDGYCWFNIVAHENIAFMHLKNKNEIEEIKKMGFKFSIDEYSGELFYEDY
ncbi:hypothetical protein [uncultured Clostridium sp.]|mgnify:CR=1 FL=1|uniref:hypothetical protein n=1 Tax=uncultured Clostridium sp. TaxID=59620 RepID=UPI0025CDE164|nr:hypothetical protein [uncultured Clostridium sp.]